VRIRQPLGPDPGNAGGGKRQAKKILFSVLKGRFPSWKAAFLMKSAVADFISGILNKNEIATPVGLAMT
jgi:hypothetical protein